MVSKKIRLGFWTIVLGSFAVAAAAPWSGGLPRQDKSARKSTDPPTAARGKFGQDLFLAIDHRDLSGAQALIKRGADPNSRNGLEFTPLFIAAASYQMDVMEALLAAGAEADAKSTYGTPLMFAAMTGNIAGGNILFAKSANVDAIRGDGTSVLMMAANAGNPAFVAELLKRRADVNTKNESGATALVYAARSGHIEVGRMLVEAGAAVDSVDEYGQTPLMVAAATGHADFVKLLLQHGAKPNAMDRAGRTPLILAASYGDYPQVVNNLVEAGAEPNLADGRGRTAAAIAIERGYKGSIALLGKTTPAAMAAVGATRSAKPAIIMSLKTLQSSMAEFSRNAACISCHQEGLGRMTTGAARDRGFSLDPVVQRIQAERVGGALNAMRPLHQQALKNPEVMKQVPLIEINEVTSGYVWLMAGMAAQQERPSEAAAAMAMVLARQQLPDGHWSFSMPRAPMQSSPFTFTALAVRSLATYGPKSGIVENAKRIAQAKAWLLKTHAQTSDDRTFRLLGLKWSGATADQMRTSIKDLLAAQNPDGGWSQMAGMTSDAYATGQVLYALRIAGNIAAANPVYQRGAHYLLRTQDPDGSWFVNKRAIPANNYFDAGFPHGESQYASFNGTCWATMALLQDVDRK